MSVLTHSDLGATQYHLVTDSSNYAIGAALHQIINGDPVPLLKKLFENQRKYSIFDRELLAASLAVLHFKSQIES